MSNALALAIDEETAAEERTEATAASTEETVASTQEQIGPTLALYAVQIGEGEGAPELGTLPGLMFVYATDEDAAWNAYACATGLLLPKKVPPGTVETTPLFEALVGGWRAGTVFIGVNKVPGDMVYQAPPTPPQEGSEEERESTEQQHQEGATECE